MEEVTKTMGDALMDLFTRKENTYLMAAAWIIVYVVEKYGPKRLTENATFVRLLPVYPLILCVGGIWIPGIRPEEAAADGSMVELGWGVTLFIGLVLGFAVGHGHKTFFQSVLGRDDKVKDAKDRKLLKKARAGPKGEMADEDA